VNLKSRDFEESTRLRFVLVSGIYFGTIPWKRSVQSFGSSSAFSSLERGDFAGHLPTVHC